MPGSAPGGAAPTAAPALPTYAPSNEAGGSNAGSTAGASAAPAPGEGSTVVPVTTGGQAEASTTPVDQPAAAQAAPAGPDGSYAAEIAADQQVAVSAQVAGQVLEVLVDVGAQVKEGDVLARLDSAALEAQRAQALASLEAAKSQLELLQDPAKAQDVAAANAAIAAASAAYDRAANGPTGEEQRMAEAQLRSAQAAVTIAQAAYNRVKGDPNIGMMPQSLQLQQATLAAEGAQAQYDKLMKGATPDQVAAASAQLANARAGLQKLLDGAKPAQIEAATAQMHAAENALYLATLQVEKATVTAPMDGVVSKLQTAAGAMAAPGAPLMTLLSNDVRITAQVEETLLPVLAPGQPATIRVEAYPDRTFKGTIAFIAPELDPTTRTVAVTVRPDNTPDNGQGLLRPGMSATVEFGGQ
ncbi:MAG: efflux RND transporter periplasmic adaptor subunit [Caldilineaceae bacterium]